MNTGMQRCFITVLHMIEKLVWTRYACNIKARDNGARQIAQIVLALVLHMTDQLQSLESHMVFRAPQRLVSECRAQSNPWVLSDVSSTPTHKNPNVYFEE